MNHMMAHEEKEKNKGHDNRHVGHGEGNLYVYGRSNRGGHSNRGGLGRRGNRGNGRGGLNLQFIQRDVNNYGSSRGNLGHRGSRGGGNLHYRSRGGNGGRGRGRGSGNLNNGHCVSQGNRNGQRYSPNELKKFLNSFGDAGFGIIIDQILGNVIILGNNIYILNKKQWTLIGNCFKNKNSEIENLKNQIKILKQLSLLFFICEFVYFYFVCCFLVFFLFFVFF